jgi:hypothetical protein
MTDIRVGRKVLFVGGTEAGNVRVIPESHGDVIRGGERGIEEYYHIWPIRLKGADDVMYLAYDADKHPMQMLLEMWREYSPVAQIKRNNPDVAPTYQKVGQQK